MSIILTPEEVAARRSRNRWIAIAIVAFVLLVFGITVAQMQAGVAVGPPA